MKKFLQHLQFVCALPLLLILKVFGKEQHLTFVASKIEAMFGAKVYEIDIGDGTHSLPLEYFFHSSLKQCPTQQQLQVLAKAIGIPPSQVRITRNSRGYIFILPSKAIDIVQIMCNAQPSLAGQWLNKVKEMRWLYIHEEDLNTTHWSLERQLILSKYFTLISLPKKIHQIRRKVWGWALQRFDPLPPEKKNVSTQEYFDAMDVDKAIRHLEHIVDNHPHLDIADAFHIIKKYRKKDQKALHRLLKLTLIVEQRDKDLLDRQRMRKEGELRRI